MSLSESVLKKLSKDKVIALALEYQNKFDSTLANINKEISALRQNYEKMQSELCISRQVSSKLREETVSLERQCRSNCQYSRRECLELSGLSESWKFRTGEHSSFSCPQSWMSKKTFPTLRIATGCQVKGQKESLIFQTKRCKQHSEC